MKEERIKVIFKEPKKLPVVMEIDNTLEQLQSLVDGYIECSGCLDVYGTTLICNEEGALKGLENNILPRGDMIIKGNVVVCGVEGDELRSLSAIEEVLADWVLRMTAINH